MLRGERSEVEISRNYGLHNTTRSKRKRLFLVNGAELFGGSEEVERNEKKIAELERVLGQKVVEPVLLRNLLGGG